CLRALPRPPLFTRFPSTPLFRSEVAQRGFAQRFFAQFLWISDRRTTQPAPLFFNSVRTNLLTALSVSNTPVPSRALASKSGTPRAEEHTSELQPRENPVCPLRPA